MPNAMFFVLLIKLKSHFMKNRHFLQKTLASLVYQINKSFTNKGNQNCTADLEAATPACRARALEQP